MKKRAAANVSILIFSMDMKQIVVTADMPNRWVLPHGVVGDDDRNMREAAVRVAVESCGVRTTVDDWQQHALVFADGRERGDDHEYEHVYFWTRWYRTDQTPNLRFIPLSLALSRPENFSAPADHWMLALAVPVAGGYGAVTHYRIEEMIRRGPF